MADLQNRGRIKVNTDSWMWRWYRSWQGRKGDQRAVPDLCHFMRVLLIFGPWRWFWSLNHRVPPFIVVAVGLIVSAFTYLVIHWPSAVMYVSIVMLITLAIVSVLVLLVYGVIRWRSIDPDRADEVMLNIAGWGTIWLWGPIYLAAMGAEWLWYRILQRPFRRVFAKPLFYVAYRETIVGIWIYLFVVFAIYGVLLVYWPRRTLLFTAGFIAGIALITAIAVGGTLTVKKTQRWLDERPAPPPRPVKIVPAEPAKERWRGTRLFWEWLVAKKHRICPLIEPIGETHE